MFSSKCIIPNISPSKWNSGNSLLPPVMTWISSSGKFGIHLRIDVFQENLIELGQTIRSGHSERNASAIAKAWNIIFCKLTNRRKNKKNLYSPWKRGKSVTCNCLYFLIFDLRFKTCAAVIFRNGSTRCFVSLSFHTLKRLLDVFLISKLILK